MILGWVGLQWVLHSSAMSVHSSSRWVEQSRPKLPELHLQNSEADKCRVLIKLTFTFDFIPVSTLVYVIGVYIYGVCICMSRYTHTFQSAFFNKRHP